MTNTNPTYEEHQALKQKTQELQDAVSKIAQWDIDDNNYNVCFNDLTDIVDYCRRTLEKCNGL